MQNQRSSETIRIAVQPKLKTKVREKAAKLGVNMSTYIKYLILTDLRGIPVFEASNRVKRNIEKSVEEGGIRTGGRGASEVLKTL